MTGVRSPTGKHSKLWNWTTTTST